MSKKQIPNILSAIRLLLVPVFAAVFFSDASRYWALAIFLAAGLTDILDGYLARRNGWITDVGKILDPLADKLMQFAAFVCLAVKQPFLVFLAVLIAVKELAFLIGGSYILKKMNFVVVSKWYGKLATFILTVTVCTLILFYSVPAAVYICSAVSAAAVLFAFVMYISYYYKQYRANNAPEKKDSSI